MYLAQAGECLILGGLSRTLMSPMTPKAATTHVLVEPCSKALHMADKLRIAGVDHAGVIHADGVLRRRAHDKCAHRDAVVMPRLDRAAAGHIARTALNDKTCLLYTSPSPRDQRGSRMPSSA